MLMTILFYLIVICFALIVILWSISEMMHNWQFGAITSIIYVVGVIVLLVRMIAVLVTGQFMSLNGLLAIFSFVFGLCCCYLQFSLMGTMIAPLSAFLLIAIEMSDRFLKSFDFWLPTVQSGVEPWIRPAVVCAIIGFAFAIATIMLGIIAFLRRRGTNENTNPMIVSVTMKMFHVFARFLLLALFILTLALMFYGIYCQTLFGVIWLGQPLFVLVVVGWLVLFSIKVLWMER